MRQTITIQNSLVDVDDSVLVVIDIQDHFLNKYDRAKSATLVSKVVWLLKVADLLDVPVVAMAEDIEHTGNLTQAVQDALPKDTKIHSKNSFGLAGDPEILQDVIATGRRTAICVGMETDVCVAQSAIGLVGEGFNVVALRDVIASMDADEEIGIGRMRDAGVAISSVKAIYYEWIRSVSKMVSLRKTASETESVSPPATLVL